MGAGGVGEQRRQDPQEVVCPEGALAVHRASLPAVSRAQEEHLSQLYGIQKHEGERRNEKMTGQGQGGELGGGFYPSRGEVQYCCFRHWNSRPTLLPQNHRLLG